MKSKTEILLSALLLVSAVGASTNQAHAQSEVLVAINGNEQFDVAYNKVLDRFELFTHISNKVHKSSTLSGLYASADPVDYTEPDDPGTSAGFFGIEDSWYIQAGGFPNNIGYIDGSGTPIDMEYLQANLGSSGCGVSTHYIYLQNLGKSYNQALKPPLITMAGRLSGSSSPYAVYITDMLNMDFSKSSCDFWVLENCTEVVNLTDLSSSSAIYFGYCPIAQNTATTYCLFGVFNGLGNPRELWAATASTASNAWKTSSNWSSPIPLSLDVAAEDDYEVVTLDADSRNWVWIVWNENAMSGLTPVNEIELIGGPSSGSGSWWGQVRQSHISQGITSPTVASAADSGCLTHPEPYTAVAWEEVYSGDPYVWYALYDDSVVTSPTPLVEGNDPQLVATDDQIYVFYWRYNTSNGNYEIYGRLLADTSTSPLCP